MKLSDDIYSFPWNDPYANNANSFLIGGSVPTLVDPGHAQFVPRLVEQMEGDGIAPDSVRLVVVTHAHPDHFEGAAFFAERGAVVAMGETEARIFEPLASKFYAAMGLEMPKLEIDLFLVDGELDVGDRRIRVIACPGHSPGSIALFVEEGKALITGDVIFLGSVGRTDLPGGDAARLARSIEALDTLGARSLLPGHGDVILDPAEVKRNFTLIRNSGILPFGR